MSRVRIPSPAPSPSCLWFGMRPLGRSPTAEWTPGCPGWSDTKTSHGRSPGMDQKNLADLYHLDPIPWSVALAALESNEPQQHTPFLATVRPDGRPHMAGVGALWDEGKV